MKMLKTPIPAGFLEMNQQALNLGMDIGVEF